MLKAIRSPWFAFGLFAVSIALAVFFKERQSEWLGVALTAFFFGVVDIIGRHKEDV